MTRCIRGLSQIEAGFDAVLIDQFGVLHDGQAAFGGASECLDELARLGRPVIALTNSGKRSEPNIARLERLGFARCLFSGLVSSGELARQMLQRDLAEGELAADAPVAVLSRDRDLSVIDGLPLRAVAPEQNPALLLIAGVEPERRTREDYRAMLAPLAARGVPAICANPDQVMHLPGGPGFGAGPVAEDYMAAGGGVVMLGKPAPAMFAAALARLSDIPPSRVLMIGDSPPHDIAGAAAAGCTTLLIRGGVQAGLDADPPPDFAMDRLIW